MDPMTAMMLAQGVGSLFKGFSARRQEKAAAREQQRYQNKVASLEANRQEVIDPYRNVKDLSSMVTNPFANLQVATRAAEMQAEETDITLAATLDTLRATGAGSGGATALAQGAARSKMNIAANIEKQEAANARLRAQGEQELQKLKLSEAQRVQMADVAGEKFMFGVTEQRQMQELNRAQAMASQYMGAAASFRSQADAGFGGALGGLAAFGLSGGFKSNK